MACRGCQRTNASGRILPPCSVTIMSAFAASGKVTCHRQAVDIENTSWVAAAFLAEAGIHACRIDCLCLTNSTKEETGQSWLFCVSAYVSCRASGITSCTPWLAISSVWFFEIEGSSVQRCLRGIFAASVNI